ncbi:MAG: hypothetical protein CMF96_04190 [Candidatus Marinimicrobia bacterium]|nr:hypothetical protein [Candidatus Neomarinimicrobiota bacterium]
MTLIKACNHITNYTSVHESGRFLESDQKYNLIYPENHIESDNRLTWFLGTLDKLYGNDAFYLKLTREKEKISNSYLKRKTLNQGILQAFAVNIFQQKKWSISNSGYDWAAKHYVDTVYNNIDFFLKNKSNKMELDIDYPIKSFKEFWLKINAEGDLKSATREFSKKYNSSK